jgi:geranylgeranyl diphosphate synthase type II
LKNPLLKITMTEFDLKSYLNRQKKLIDDTLIEYLRRLCPSHHLLEPVTYAVMAGGKRLRPVLCLAAGNAVADDSRSALAVACAIEMIHTYSLIHDDLPALDDDQLRRGKPTCHVQFNEATAILSGDALLTMAFETICEAGLSSSVKDARKWLQVIDIISHASGCRGMIEGQARDLAFEGIRLTPEALQCLHELKTGALIRAAVHCGALLAGGSPEQIDHLIDYATRIGLAFQVVDDILNITGDPDLLGKSVGTDQQRQKNTYPALMGLDQSRKFAGTLINSALQALAIFDNKADPLRAIARYIIERRR